MLVMLVGANWASLVGAADWQWAIDTGVKTHGKAFLWIPPTCEQVRGLIVGQQVILEKLALEDPQIRAAATRQHLAILFIVPGAIAYDDFGSDGKGEETYNKIVGELAGISGYAEIAQAPFLTIGHSGGALPAWRMGYWKPERSFGVIGLRAAPIPPPAHDPKAQLNGVPVLVITGQYETWNPRQSAEHHWRWCRGDILAMRVKWDQALMSVLVQPGAGHFNWDEKVARYVAMFIEKAARYRIPAEQAPRGELPKLKDLPLLSGWLTDHTLMSPVRYPTASYADYTGDPTIAFWHLDEELARANEAFGLSDQGKKPQLVTFVDNGNRLEPAWIQDLEFKPIDDGMTVKVQASFVEHPRVNFTNAGMPDTLGHAEGPIKFRLIGGWSGGGEQIGADTFRIRFDRFMLARKQKNASLMVMAYHPGDAKYGYAEQPATIKLPFENTEGKPQSITFAEIPDQQVGTKSIMLKATADSGLPVEFCVIQGPVRIEGNKVGFTKLPPCTKFPVKVTIAAWQWGRSIEPFVQSAPIVERSFKIHKSATLAKHASSGAEDAGRTIRDFAQRDTRAVSTCVYKQVGDQDLRLLVCKPDGWQAGQKRPAMVWIHGGGWVAGEPELFLPHMKYSAARGAVALGVQYRLLRSPGHKHDKEKSQEENRGLREAKLQAFLEGPSLFDCVADVQDAIRYIRKHAEELGVDPNRVTMIGDSSGAHLACCAETLAGNDARPNAVVACSAVTDLTSGFGLNSVKPTDGYDYDDPQKDPARTERARRLSPIYNVKKTDTAFLVLHGARDWIKAERPKAFYQALRQAGNDCEFKLYDDAWHAFIVYGYTATDEQITRAILDLDAFLGKRGLLEGPSQITMPETE